MNDLKVAEQIAWNLRQSGDVALIVDGKRALFARFFPDSTKYAATSAAMKLIQGIYSRDPLMARKIVRHRIFSTETPDEMCLGMVRVAAKRMTSGVVPQDHSIQISHELEEIETQRGLLTSASVPLLSIPSSDHHDGWMRLALNLATQAKRVEQKFESDRPVAALLVSSTGMLLEWAVNSNAENRTFHAEINLVQNYCARTQQRLPLDSRIYTTLKCCKMCAGMIWESAADPSRLLVYFWDDDPGSNARLTVFNKDSFERERASQANPDLANIEPESCLKRELADS